MKKDATIDVTEQYRYTLLREWDSNAPRVAFVMLNPSTGDAQIDDNTINRCINFARSWEYGSIEVVNLFGYRSKNFDYIKGVSNPIGNENNEFISTVVNRASIVVAAWGDNGTYLSRDLEVIALISEVKDVYCLGITSKGNPRHPLYLDSSTMLEMYKPSDGSSVMNKEELQSSNVQGEEVASTQQISSTVSVSVDSELKNLLDEDTVKDEQNKIKVTDKRCAAQRCGPNQNELTNGISLGVSDQIINENKNETKKKNKTSKTTYIILALFIIGAIYWYTSSQSQNTSSTSNANYLVTNRASINEMITQFNSLKTFSSVAEYPEGVDNRLFAKQTDTGFALELIGNDLDHINSAQVYLELVNIQDAEKSMVLLKGFFGHIFPSDFGAKTTTWAFKQIKDMDNNDSLTEQTMISEGNKITVEHLQNQKNDTYFIHIEKTL